MPLPPVRYGRRIVSRIERLRHLKGHGIHSPFVYGLVRNGLKRNGERSRVDKNLISEMIAEGVTTEAARKICNLYYHLGMERFLYNRIEAVDETGPTLLVLSAEYADNRGAAVVEESLRQCAVIILSGRRAGEFGEAAAALIKSGRYLSIDVRKFVLLIDNNDLSPQHFKV